MNYLFYDYETSGTCEKFDQVFQFAAIKTDDQFNQIDEPVELFCKLRPDVLPSPQAIRTNQIDLNELDSKGLCEFEFAKKVCAALMGSGNQCIVGYNSKEFDNNFTRFLFYRNFQDPYAWSWVEGNWCLDIIDILRLGYSFDRLGDICVNDGSGADSLRLENLAKWNGITHSDSHDALSDVKATIQLAALLKKKCPRLFEYAEGLRNLAKVRLAVLGGEMFFHSCGYNGYDRRFLSLHTPICGHPVFGRSHIGWDLHCDPTQLLRYSADEVRAQMYSKKDERQIEVGFTEFKLNKSPMVTRFSKNEKTRLPNFETCEENLEKVRNNLGELVALAKKVFDSAIPEIDPDADLYAGDYFTEVNGDREPFGAVSDNPLLVEESSFKSLRLRRLLRRLKARNYFDQVCKNEQTKFKQFCSEKFACTEEGKWRTRTIFEREFAEVIAASDLSERQKNCLNILKAHADKLH